MKTIEIQFDINDIVYRADGNVWDAEMNNYRNYVVGKYIVRSISISCNSKGEWKRSYRVQQEINGRIIGYGFNFRDEDIGSEIFVNYEDAKKHCLELVHSNKNKISQGGKAL